MNRRSSAKTQPSEINEFEEKVVQINRVSKKTKGGNRIGFSALMVVGDRKGRVGVALGKAPDTLAAIRKGVRRARKRLIKVPMRGTTILFPMRVKLGAAEVLLKPAPSGTGVIAGGAVRAVVEAAGIRDVVAKILGSSNKASNVYATFDALSKMQKIAKKKQIDLQDKKEEEKQAAREEDKENESVKRVKKEPRKMMKNQTKI